MEDRAIEVPRALLQDMLHAISLFPPSKIAALADWIDGLSPGTSITGGIRSKAILDMAIASEIKELLQAQKGTL